MSPTSNQRHARMIGSIDAGGGERGIYGAGVMDRLLDDGIMLDLCIGVSAGSANASTYLARQRGRTKRFYLDYAFRRDYMSIGNFFRKGSYVDYDYIYSTLSNSTGEDPFDYQTFVASKGKLLVVATDAQTGEPHYFTKADMAQDSYDIMKASCSLPVVGPPYVIGDHSYFDGGLSDPIPVRRALEEGCERVVVILTRPRDQYRKAKGDIRKARLLRRNYPRMAQALCDRAAIYNAQLDEAKRLEAEGRAVILAPASIEGLGTLTKDRAKIEGLYDMGYEDAGCLKDIL